LQLFVELLSLGQHFLKTLAVAGRLDRQAEVVGHLLEQFCVTVRQRAQEAQFEHAIDLAIVPGRHQQRAARQAFADAGAEPVVIFRQRIEPQQPFLPHCLGQQAFVPLVQLLTGLRFGTQAITGHARQLAMLVTYIEGADHAAQVTGEKAQRVIAEHRQGELAEHLLGQLRLPIAQPGVRRRAAGPAGWRRSCPTGPADRVAPGRPADR